MNRALISGGTGLVGQATAAVLKQAGWEVVLLSRNDGEGRVQWNPAEGTLNAAEIEGFDAIIHLAGESIQGRWTADKKEKIRQSRIQGTTLLAETIAKLSRKPAVFISASGANFYGTKTPNPATELTPQGDGFLSEVSREWEAATEAAGVRTVCLRIAMVLAAEGGALAKLLPIFKKGLGGPVGSGEQMVSWIHVDDLARSILFCIENESLSGAVNAAAPQPITNKQFTAAIGKACNKPAVLPVPAFAVRAAFGQMAEETVLADQAVIPEKLSASGFTFNHNSITNAVESCLKETR